MVARKKKPQQPQTVDSGSLNSVVSTELDGVETSSSSAAVDVVPSEPAKKQFCFKDYKLESNSVNTPIKKPRTFKTLKQIVASERSLPWKPDDALYCTIDAPPSFKPAKKYSDISGLPAAYTDPQTKLRYATAEEYSRVRLLPIDIVYGLLTLRRANSVMP